MAANDFFSRWARKTESANPEVSQGNLRSEPLPLPTSDDVDALNTSSDFTPFFAQGVDDLVKRLALKKLFSDPRFNIMDGLDIYIEDYNTFVPMTAEMVSELNHAKLLMDPLAHLKQPIMQMLETPLPKLVEENDDAVDASEGLAVEAAGTDIETTKVAEKNTAPEDDAPDIVEPTDTAGSRLPQEALSTDLVIPVSTS
ncbi:DUF3306 domain-containing protein [Actimicrobium sp. CCC2.4]|uniref:DUF3306 domain-containing protein n=1 Tax=Actimicrobium sp. CCC2.4 TaxID=3048606 RepID=UPI002AC9BCD4|nr:DUF3306 domain-containing protein [Actimicrobium sp. CCC2.4]MEB0137260.1 DUF3306 domain-containing protein [Actimicrobium sp. CCC2.4]WPX33474.1 DUF3306 domain-containing protein [Actimicrobium sp. CCC2.4]